MTPHVYLQHELQHKQEIVKLKRPILLDRTTIIKVVNDARKPFLVQFDKIHICYQPLLDVYQRINLILRCAHKQAESLANIESYIFQKVSNSKWKHMVENKTPATSDKVLLKLKGHVGRIMVFDNKRDTLDYSHLGMGQNVSCIFQIDYFWITQQCYGFVYILHQIMVNENVHTNHCFLFKNELERYEKMVKVGVPLPAVIQKMRIENMNTVAIETFQKQYSHMQSKSIMHQHPQHNGKIYPPPPPPGPPPPPPGPLPPPPPPGPPPPPPPLQLQYTRLPPPAGKPLFLIDIETKNFKLKRKEDNDRTQKPITSARPKNGFAPTLDEILNMRSRLKCLKKVYHHHYVPASFSSTEQ